MSVRQHYSRASSPYEHYTNLKTQKDLVWDIKHAAKKKKARKAREAYEAAMESRYGPNWWLRDLAQGFGIAIIIVLVAMLVGG